MTINVFKRPETSGDWHQRWAPVPVAPGSRSTFRPSHQHIVNAFIEAPQDTIEGLAEMLQAVIDGGISRSSSRGGVFELHCDAGIWSHETECRMDPSTPAKAAKCKFESWAEMEDQDAFFHAFAGE